VIPKPTTVSTRTEPAWRPHKLCREDGSESGVPETEQPAEDPRAPCCLSPGSLLGFDGITCQTFLAHELTGNDLIEFYICSTQPVEHSRITGYLRREGRENSKSRPRSDQLNSFAEATISSARTLEFSEVEPASLTSPDSGTCPLSPVAEGYMVCCSPIMTSLSFS
jgi:hypothetical protein